MVFPKLGGNLYRKRRFVRSGLIATLRLTDSDFVTFGGEASTWKGVWKTLTGTNAFVGKHNPFVVAVKDVVRVHNSQKKKDDHDENSHEQNENVDADDDDGGAIDHSVKQHFEMVFGLAVIFLSAGLMIGVLWKKNVDRK